MRAKTAEVTHKLSIDISGCYVQGFVTSSLTSSLTSENYAL